MIRWLQDITLREAFAPRWCSLISHIFSLNPILLDNYHRVMLR